jgi:group II intron reverse transcriptase/maturase
MGRLIARILTPQNLRAAWEEVAGSGGMPGVDRVSIRRWRRNWEERLVRLSAAIRGNRYEPAPLRVRRIPKKQPGEWRTLRIPTVTDRVAQRAALQVLYGVYEPLFLDCSFGYRPGRDLRGAVQRIVDLRERGLDWVLDADIDAFFDNVDHDVLLRLLEERVADAILLRLIRQWLDVARVEEDEARGIAMGSPLSPLLANVYLHPLDCALVEAGWEPVRYADDFIALARTRAGAEAAYAYTEGVLDDLKLRYEPRKTGIASFEEGFEFLGVRFLEDSYSYVWQDKVVEVEGDRADWLFGRYGPRYE